jgi:hypothetical protein
VNLALVPGKEQFIADQGDRLRVAAAMGIISVPVMFSVYDAGVIAGQCGLEAPVEAAGVLGAASPDNPDAPPEGPEDAPPEAPEPPEQPTAPPPAPPPEIEPPQPPQPELPVSPN